jgi:hypothetical protein
MATKFVFNPIVGRFDEVLDYSDIFTAMTEPTGFVDKVATLSFVDATRVFTITGAHDIYINGVKSSKTTSSITIDDATGINWIYYNAAGVLSQSVSIPSFSLPLVATVYYNTVTDKGLLGEERHGIKMDCDTHTLLHYTVGVRYESGLTGTFADTTFSVSAGIIDDEDLAHSITPAKTTCNVLYKDGAADYKWLAGQTVYYYTSGGNLYYNNGNTLTAMDSNKYVAYWIFATNDTTTPIVSLMGQRQDTVIADARTNNKYESLTFGTLPYQEMKLLYRVILRNDATPYEEVQDLRTVSNLPAGTYVATDHGVLTGLTDDDHSQYWLSGVSGRTDNYTTTGTLGAGVSTFAGNNSNAAFTLLNLNNNFTPLTGQVAQTSDLVFNLTQSINSVVSLHEAAKISAYKVSDWFHASAETDTDSGLKFWTTNSGTPTLQLTIDEAGLATFVGNIVVPTEYIGSTPNTGMVHPLQINGNLGTPRSSIVRRDIGTTIPNYTGVWNVNTVDTNTVGYIDVTATGATKGGMQITGFTGSDTTATTIPLLMGGVIGTASPGATQPTMVFRGGKWNGTTGISSIGTTGVLAVWRNWATDVLTIYGNGNITTAGTGAFGGFQLGTSTTAGYVLTADASGIGTWQSAGAGSQTPWGQNIDAAGFNLTGLGDGTNTVDLADGTYAVNATGAGNFVSGSYTALFGGSAGGYFTDTSNYVYLADGSSAINATGNIYVTNGASSGTGVTDTYDDGTDTVITFVSGIATGISTPFNTNTVTNKEALTSVLDKIRNINAYSYKYAGKERFGFLADEIAPNFPEATVIDRHDKKEIGYRKDAVIAILWKAVQELALKVEALEKK